MTLELWAGAECTVNRVGDRYRDQLEHSGFSSRLEDLDRLASLGVRRLRFPLLWERTAPQSPDQQDWRWADTRIGRLRELGIVPIVGLLHHGSGPPYTNLLDAKFSGLFARYALAVAERYPGRGGVYAGQRAADHRALQRPVRHLVSALPRRHEFRTGAAQSGESDRARDARDPRGECSSAARANRRSGTHRQLRAPAVPS